MTTLRRAVLLACALVFCVPLAAGAVGPGPEKPVRTLAVIPFYAPERMWQLYTPFVEYLTRETGERWELKLFPNHESMVEGVCAGTVDVTLLGPVPLGRVNRKCGAVPFLVSLDKAGKPEYHAMLLTAEPGVTAAAGLRGKRIGLMKGSTAAHVLPLQMLREAGIGPGDFQPVFLESQDRIMAALLAREVAGAGVKEALYLRFAKEPAIRLLQVSQPLPNFSLAALPAQPPDVRDRVVVALLRLRPLERPRDAEVVKGWDDEIKNGFVLPPAGFLPAALNLAEIAEKTLHESR
jgi:phosphonate transport system substrate-binding protein